MVWGMASFPVATGFVLILLCDVLLAGEEAYTSDQTTSLATGWTVASMVLATSLAAWSIYLFGKGMAIVSGLRHSRSAAVVVFAGICLAIAAVGILGVLNIIDLLLVILK